MKTIAPTRIRWILVVCITVMVSIFFVDRVNISIAGHAIAQVFRLTDVQLGKLLALFFWAMRFFRFRPVG